MTWFLAIGALGLLVVLASLVLADVFEGAFESLDIDVGAGLFSTPVIGSFLAAFGFGAALVQGTTEASTGVAAVVGLGAGVVLGGLALVITRALMHMPTDETVRLTDLVGRPAVVVSAIPASGLGEVSLVHLGQRMKLNASAPKALAFGTEVVVIAVTSASSVVVEEAIEFWGPPAPLQQGE